MVGGELQSDDGRFVGDLVHGDVVDVEGGLGAVGHGDDFRSELGSGIEEDGFFGGSGQGVEVDAGR